jgi:hypothetical protein
VPVSGGVAPVVVVSVDSCSGVRLRDMVKILLVDVREILNPY